MQSDTTGWMGNAGAGFAFTKNDQEIIQVNINAHIQYKTKKDLWLLLADHGFLKSGSEKLISSSFVHLRYNYKISKWLRWEALAQVQNNYVTLIDARYLAGTGPRFKVFDSRHFKLYAACLFMYEHERERTSPVVLHNDFRNSSYISFTILPGNNIELISTTFYQPLVNKIKDTRILNQSVMKLKTGKHFWFSLLWNYLHDRFPAGDAPKTTYNFSMGINYEF
ncbi:MAG: DUF481 domain-containing protein [Bacteroidota bacterium]